ncbi:MAG: hypothetical protein J6D03_09155 [Clostridia bacterium]|nr:hypothetical protein [Clostridia bacterium]
MYPVVEIYIDNIIQNAFKVREICKDRGITLSLVTKVLSDNKEIVQELVRKTELIVYVNLEYKI